MTEKEAFINWGFMNGWTDEIYEQFHIARDMHNEAMEKDPEHHKMTYVDTQSGWHEYTCSCGFHWGVDSGD